MKAGSKDEARRNLALAVAGDPAFPGVEEARAVLRGL
jgi:hypothetical protein